jgi:Flp pilus assembly protein TadD
VQAKSGDPERAIGAAQRALALDARSADALIALAVGETRLRRYDEARQAWAELQRVAANEADALVPTLVRLGLSVSPAGR